MPFRQASGKRTAADRTVIIMEYYHSKGFKTIKSGIVKVRNAFYLRL